MSAQTAAEQKIEIENEVDQWKKGFIILKNGSQYFGDLRCSIKSGTLSDQIEFRQTASDSSQFFWVNSCKSVLWGDLELTSLPDTGRKHSYDKLFCMTSFVGNSISLFYEPKFTKSSKPKSVRFIVLKEGVFTSITKANFKKSMYNLFADSPIWREKATDKQWFSYANVFEVTKFYDENIILVSTDFKD